MGYFSSFYSLIKLNWFSENFLCLLVIFLCIPPYEISIAASLQDNCYPIQHQLCSSIPLFVSLASTFGDLYVNYIQTRTVRWKSLCTKVQPQIEYILFSDLQKLYIYDIQNSITFLFQPFNYSTQLLSFITCRKRNLW